MKKLAVDNADNLLSYQIIRRLPLYSEQKDRLSKDVDGFLNQEKTVAREILPVIDDIDLSAPEKLDVPYLKFEGFYERVARDFAELLSTHMAELDSKQQKEMFEILDDENRKILSKEKEERVDDIEENFDRALGSITGPQKQIVRTYEDYFHGRARQRLDRRVKLHRELRDIFRQDASPASRKTQIEAAFREYQTDVLKGNKNLEILKKIVPTVTGKQREHFRAHVEDLRGLLKYYLTVDY
jgi:hypothetical protein